MYVRPVFAAVLASMASVVMAQDADWFDELTAGFSEQTAEAGSFFATATSGRASYSSVLSSVQSEASSIQSSLSAEYASLTSASGANPASISSSLASKASEIEASLTSKLNSAATAAVITPTVTGTTSLSTGGVGSAYQTGVLGVMGLVGGAMAFAANL